MPMKRKTSPAVQAYLDALSPDRRTIVDAIRKAILANLDDDYEEGIQYRAIGYYVPHGVFPPGYHCDPKQPLPFAGLGSQKQYVSFGLMCLYGDGSDTEAERDLRWFVDAWKKTGKKLDMGKVCIRIKRLEDVPLEVIGEAVRRVPAKVFVERYLRSRDLAAQRLAERRAGGSKKPAAATKAPSRKAPARPAKAATAKRAGKAVASGARRSAK